MDEVGGEEESAVEGGSSSIRVGPCDGGGELELGEGGEEPAGSMFSALLS